MARVPDPYALPDVAPARDPGVKLPEAVYAAAYGYDITTAAAKFGTAGVKLAEDIAKERQDQEDATGMATLQTEYTTRGRQLHRDMQKEAGEGAPNFTKNFQARLAALRKEVVEGTRQKLAISDRVVKAFDTRAIQVDGALIEYAATWEDQEKKRGYRRITQNNVDTISIAVQQGSMHWKDGLQQIGEGLENARRNFAPDEFQKLEEESRLKLGLAHFLGMADRNPAEALRLIKKTPAEKLAKEFGFGPEHIRTIDRAADTELRKRSSEARMSRMETRQQMGDAVTKAQVEGAYVLPSGLKTFDLYRQGFKDADVKDFSSRMEAATFIGEARKEMATAPADKLPEIISKYSVPVLDVTGFARAHLAESEVMKSANAALSMKRDLAGALFRDAAAKAFQYDVVTEPGSQERVIFQTRAPSLDEWKANVAPIMGEDFAEKSYKTIEIAKRASKASGYVDDLPKILEQAGQKAATPEAIDYATRQFARRVMTEREKGLKEDPGGYVDKHDLNVRVAKAEWATHASTPSGPGLMKHYVDTLFQAQSDMGALDPKFPKDFTGDFMRRWESAGGEQRSAMLAAMESGLGQKFPLLLRDLQTDAKASSDLRVIAMRPEAPQAKMLASISKQSIADLKKVLKDDSEAASIDDKVRGALAELRASMPMGAVEMSGAIRDSVYKLAMMKRGEGASVGDSVEWASQWLTEPYRFFHVRGAVVRVPARAQASSLAMERFLGDFKDDAFLPVDWKQRGLTEDQTREAVQRSIRSKGRIIAAEGDTGFRVYVGAYPVNDRIYPWSTLALSPGDESPEAERSRLTYGERPAGVKRQSVPSFLAPREPSQ